VLNRGNGRAEVFHKDDDDHLLIVLRYVERNPERAKTLPVHKAHWWPWSSIGTPPKEVERPVVVLGPVPRPDALRPGLDRGRSFGATVWQHRTATRLGLESTLRPRGRPKKRKEK